MEESTFLKRNAKKILVGVGLVSVVGTCYMLGRHNIQIKELMKGQRVIKKITDREKSRILFEIRTLEQYIRDLNPEINVNKFVNIPNAKERIMELYIELEQVKEDGKCLEKYAK